MGPVWVARVGFELLVAIFFGGLAGYWLDRKTGQEFFPFFSLAGFLFGSGAGLMLVYQSMKAFGSGPTAPLRTPGSPVGDEKSEEGVDPLTDEDKHQSEASRLGEKRSSDQ